MRRRATARTSPAAARFEVDDDDEYAAFADAVMRRRTNHDEMLGSVMLRGPGASLVEPPGTFALTGMPEAREREPGTVGKFFGDWRPSMTVRDR